MAVDFTYNNSDSLLSVNKSYQRLESLPLDNSEVIETISGVEEYAHSYETAYEGQIVYCKENETSYILVKYNGDQGYNLDYIPIVSGDITQKLIELEDYKDMVGNDKLIPISNGIINIGPTGQGLNADMVDGYNVWSGSGEDFDTLRLAGSLNSNAIYLTKNDYGFIAKEQLSPGLDTKIYTADTIDDMYLIQGVSYGDICIVDSKDIYYFSNRNYFEEITISNSAKADWMLIFGYDSVKEYIEALKADIQDLKDQMAAINENCYTKSTENEW